MAADPGDDRPAVFQFVGGVFADLAGHFLAVLNDVLGDG